MGFTRVAVAVAAALTIVPAPAPAAAEISPGTDCRVVAPPEPRTFAVALADGARATVRDRYGGAFQRNRLYVQWTVRISGFSGAAPVSAAEFVVDGTPQHTDDTVRTREPGQATLEWAALSRRFAAGDHVLRIRLRPRETTGRTREIEIPFQATECPFAVFSAAALRRPRPLAALAWTSSTETPGPPLRSVAATLVAGARLGKPKARTGAAVGTLDTGDRRYTLRAPRAGSTLLSSGALRVRLDVARGRVSVTGLPEGVTDVAVRLRAGILRLPGGCSRARFAGELRGTRDDVARVVTRDVRRC